jgi:hypothetical protein
MPTPTSRDLLIRNAIAVANSANALLLMGNAFLKEQPQMAANYFISTAILCPFGIELLLKSIHSCINDDTSFPLGHDLEQLFKNIPDKKVKNILTDLYNTETGEKLQDFLSQHKSAFQAWRYFSEPTSNPSFDYHHAMVLTEILKNKVISLVNR